MCPRLFQMQTHGRARSTFEIAWDTCGRIGLRQLLTLTTKINMGPMVKCPFWLEGLCRRRPHDREEFLGLRGLFFCGGPEGLKLGLGPGWRTDGGANRPRALRRLFWSGHGHIQWSLIILLSRLLANLTWQVGGETAIHRGLKFVPSGLEQAPVPTTRHEPGFFYT